MRQYGVNQSFRDTGKPTERAKMPKAKTFSYRTLLITLLIAMLAFALACGSSGGDEESSDDGGQTAGQQDSDGNDNGGSGGNNDDGGSGGTNNNGSGGSGSGNSGGFGDLFGLGADSGEAACEAITAVAGIPGGALAAVATDEASTGFGKNAQDFFIDLLEDALNTDVDTACIFEVEDDGDGWCLDDL